MVVGSVHTYQKPKVLKTDIVTEQRVRTNDNVDRSVCKARNGLFPLGSLHKSRDAANFDVLVQTGEPLYRSPVVLRRQNGRRGEQDDLEVPGGKRGGERSLQNRARVGTDIIRREN